MSGLIERLQDRTASGDEQLRVLDVDGAETDDVLDALGPDTRREVYRALFESPGTTSEIAERVDTSVQNLHYHLSTLEEAGLIAPVDTRYSEKGNEMTVYAPATDPLVLVGDRDIRPQVERSLTDVVGGLGILAVASLLVQWGTERLASPAIGRGNVVGPASPSGGPSTIREALAWFAFDLAEPGVVFFCGCLVVVTVAALAMDR
ncbi:helix-turn-helix domain-containing protein [Halorussus limi]|uniref:Helix-turn-helix domain-containing protein n=1 Tax=Halorussus limi TaxID=2938695 RepID=A0A8U0HYV8_9EURY|nr:helix-turn-helix domain-containing protein [Halorussus limi]UPV75826.1 helix-turn-helix domain-containing protein [Halorussus limi]